jgi:hypothetical protein
MGVLIMTGAIAGYLALLFIEAAVFGVFALSISRKGNNQYDTGKAVLIIVVLLILQMALLVPLLQYADVKIGNQELVSMLGTADVKNLMGFDFSGIIMNILEAGLGIALGKRILAKVSK